MRKALIGMASFLAVVYAGNGSWAADVMRKPAAPERDAINEWCSSVWNAFSGSRETVIRLLAENGIE